MRPNVVNGSFSPKLPIQLRPGLSQENRKNSLPRAIRSATIPLSCGIDDFDDWATSEELPTGLFCAHKQAGS
jgi:hypothetical protein